MKFPHYLLLTLIVLLANWQVQPTTTREISRGRNRMKRQQCQDGYGNWEGQQCCKCPPGFHFHLDASKCNQNIETECLPCEHGSYLDHANLRTSCEPCTSCNNEANLETDEKCTVIQNTVCKCKEGYHCDKAVREECKVCHSCKICEDGFAIEKKCTPTNDTVCKKVEEGEGLWPVPLSTDTGGPWWIVLIVLLLIVAIIAIAIVLKKKKLVCFDNPYDEYVVDGAPMENYVNERIPLKGIDLFPHLDFIVKELGPKTTMELVRGDFNEASLQFHEADAQNDAQEKCYKVLKAWYEKQGLEDAAPNLIQKLNDVGKKTTADKIIKRIQIDKKE